MSAEGFKLTFVMPALNEEEGLDACIGNAVEGIERAGVAGEVVVVNDGSTDRTGEIAASWAARDPRVRVLTHPERRGIGASFWDGVGAARGEVVTFLPGDGENDGYEILRYLPLMEQVDVVVPFSVNREVRAPFRRLLSSLYHVIIRRTTGVSLTYLNGTVLYRKSLLSGLTLRSRGFFYQTELLLKALTLGYLYAEVPYMMRERRGGRSKALTLKSLRDVARCYLATFADLRKLKAFPLPLAPDSATARRLAGFNPGDQDDE